MPQSDFRPVAKAEGSLGAWSKLAITLRFLATGAKYQAEVWETPSTEDAWWEVAQQLQNKWNFPHCRGALDGKHIAIQKPPKSGTLYYNFKGFFCTVMLALVDAYYKFLWVDVGANGASSDAGIFNRSQLEPALRQGTLGLPPQDPLPNDDQDTPYFIVGDDAFPLRTYLMKPYSHRYLSRQERICNYRFSRGRRVVENAFGILANCFRCLLTTWD
ncbi:uncharacterized protein LOC128238097 [Mya arenaria]|uniref:uncharacterized protein LOC128238097 n=1 Tax=Mya arenaria TaxID=6604 RepID=UPI0022E83D3D|nr:uncharacterized protein LOC128238097 [Mya arenaria]